MQIEGQLAVGSTGVSIARTPMICSVYTEGYGMAHEAVGGPPPTSVVSCRLQFSVVIAVPRGPVVDEDHLRQGQAAAGLGEDAAAAVLVGGRAVEEDDVVGSEVDVAELEVPLSAGGHQDDHAVVAARTGVEGERRDGAGVYDIDLAS